MVKKKTKWRKSCTTCERLSGAARGSSLMASASGVPKLIVSTIKTVCVNKFAFLYEELDKVKLCRPFVAAVLTIVLAALMHGGIHHPERNFETSFWHPSEQ